MTDPYPADLYPGCPCFKCDQVPRIDAELAAGRHAFPNRMSLCPECGDNRCPGAVDHTQHPAPATASTGEVRVTSSTGGQKGSKPQRYDLIPAGPLRTLAELYGKGAEKYDDDNWRRGYSWRLSFAALNRHLWQFWDGQDLDEETGLPHLASVAWHAFSLLEFMERHPEFDDRPSTVEAREAADSA